MTNQYDDCVKFRTNGHFTICTEILSVTGPTIQGYGGLLLKVQHEELGERRL